MADKSIFSKEYLRACAQKRYVLTYSLSWIKEDTHGTYNVHYRFNQHKAITKNQHYQVSSLLICIYLTLYNPSITNCISISTHDKSNASLFYIKTSSITSSCFFPYPNFSYILLLVKFPLSLFLSNILCFALLRLQIVFFILDRRRHYFPVVYLPPPSPFLVKEGRVTY